MIFKYDSGDAVTISLALLQCERVLNVLCRALSGHALRVWSE